MADRRREPPHDHGLERRQDLLAIMAVGSALAFAWILGRGSAAACCNQLAVLRSQEFGAP